MMQNVMEVVIVTADGMPALMGRDAEQAAMVFRSIANWLDEMHKRPKPLRFLDCDTTFHARRMPEAFAVTLPFIPGADTGQAVTVGIYRHCVEKGAAALVHTFTERLRPHYSDLTTIQSGRA